MLVDSGECSYLSSVGVEASDPTGGYPWESLDITILCFWGAWGTRGAVHLPQTSQVLETFNLQPDWLHILRDPVQNENGGALSLKIENFGRLDDSVG